MKIKFIIILSVISLVFTSCASNQAVMKYDGSELSERIYSYWLNQYREYILSSYPDATDSDEFWNSKLSDDSDVKMKDYFIDIADINIKKNLVCIKLFDDYGLELPEETYQMIDLEIQDYIDSYGSKSEFNKALSELGINDKIYKEVYIIQEKIAMLFNHIFGEGGTHSLTDEEVENYFKNNYVRIKYISINLYDEDEEGNLVELDEEEMERRLVQAESIYNDIAAGGDFDRMFKLYSYDKLEEYKNGMYFSINNSGSHPVINEALTIEIGDVSYVEDTYVAYIVKKFELEEKPYLNEDINQVQFVDLYTLTAESLYQNMLFDYIDDIEIDYNIKNKYSLN